MRNNATTVILIILVFIQFGLIYELKHKLNQKEQQAVLGPPVAVEPPKVEEPAIQPEPEKSVQVAATYQEAISTAKANNKKIFLCFETKWCVNCTRLKNETLSDKEVQEKLSKYIIVYIDVDKDRKLARQYEVYGIPHFLIIDSDEIRYNTGTGFMPKSEFMDWLDLKKTTRQTSLKPNSYTIIQPDP